MKSKLREILMFGAAEPFFSIRSHTAMGRSPKRTATVNRSANRADASSAFTYQVTSDRFKELKLRSSTSIIGLRADRSGAFFIGLGNKPKGYGGEGRRPEIASESKRFRTD